MHPAHVVVGGSRRGRECGNSSFRKLRDIFLDPQELDLRPDWEDATECPVASLRQAVGHRADDPRLAELVTHPLEANSRFRQLWGRHDVRGQRTAAIRISQPLAGLLTVHRERLAVGGTEGMVLVVLKAGPESPDAARLAELAHR